MVVVAARQSRRAAVIAAELVRGTPRGVGILTGSDQLTMAAPGEVGGNGLPDDGE
ncbi:hypothetical protein ABZW30_39505 [Kitasatospora sp. NPDC004669]|uniref:hypothetical protein n=1 Tax=Kitasatospora sp. NPDC004669 TaxID=3154555 RepID=UPI0033AC525A